MKYDTLKMMIITKKTGMTTFLFLYEVFKMQTDFTSVSVLVFKVREGEAAMAKKQIPHVLLFGMQNEKHKEGILGEKIQTDFYLLKRNFESFLLLFSFKSWGKNEFLFCFTKFWLTVTMMLKAFFQC